ncbi:MAG TPA: hypothetical protein DCR24_13670 [Bacillus bacterium]|nr:hypothetical protein [Bacillus sp. (in: firmicutes)]
MKSTCCNVKLIKSTVIEQFHGADDEYELTIPLLICSECGGYELIVFSGEKQVAKSIQNAG